MSSEELIPLSQEQKNSIINLFNNDNAPFFTECLRAAYPDQELGVTSTEGRLVRAFCKEKNLSYEIRKIYAKPPVVLSPEQLIDIENNYRLLSVMDLTKHVFKNDKLVALGLEFRAISEYLKTKQEKDKEDSDKKTLVGTLPIINIGGEEDEFGNVPQIADYVSPRTLKQTIDRINKYLNYEWEEANLKKKYVAETLQLKKYLNIFRFLYQINTYKLQDDRDLFEDAFIRYTHDKPDLTQEDLDQFITLCNQIVRAAEIQRRMEILRGSLTSGEISMKLNEAINVLQSELNSCEKIKTQLYNDLTTKRNKRLEEYSDGSEKLINLVQAWKDEEFRQKTIHLAELEKIKVEEEGERINSMSELKALLKGATIEELVG